ncbi:hypothetical protein Taro_029242 [Colocasia esculenta]|uniref:Uncharacterized protein n=1 Tax=Colocasia esculenta TaxID=4460 RepID=A0A843VQJ8_COLES|nr:hypothetical protein [Colocasia esculenta]
MNNHLEGSLPNVHSLSRLWLLYLAHNKFSRTIADDSFSGMGTLRAVHLVDNAFTGPIPTSLALAPRLIKLNLAENGLTGTLPDFDQGGKLALNMSFNNLEGPIPTSLSRLDKSLFQESSFLCFHSDAEREGKRGRLKREEGEKKSWCPKLLRYGETSKPKHGNNGIETVAAAELQLQLAALAVKQQQGYVARGNKRTATVPAGRRQQGDAARGAAGGRRR